MLQSGNRKRSFVFPGKSTEPPHPTSVSPLFVELQRERFDFELKLRGFVEGKKERKGLEEEGRNSKETLT